MINPNAKNINHKNAFEFIGKLMILAITSGETFYLNLHPIVWKGLLENQITFKDYETVDCTFFNLINLLKEGFEKRDKNTIESLDLTFVIKNSGQKDIELIKEGYKIKVTLENVEKYINLAQTARITEINEQIKFIKTDYIQELEKIFYKY